ncbi:MAG: T9SS type A sorting domain-containing protein [Chitinophagales bacterium]|nr:T9SS type A sorting domain-containing protein [Chitinophagales bacterium]
MNSSSPLENALSNVNSIYGRLEQSYFMPSNQQLMIAVSDLPNGIYIVSTLQNGKTISSTKLVVLH